MEYEVWMMVKGQVRVQYKWWETENTQIVKFWNTDNR